jgi:hypothetical protein
MIIWLTYPHWIVIIEDGLRASYLINISTLYQHWFNVYLTNISILIQWSTLDQCPIIDFHGLNVEELA